MAPQDSSERRVASSTDDAPSAMKILPARSERDRARFCRRRVDVLEPRSWPDRAPSEIPSPTNGRSVMGRGGPRAAAASAACHACRRRCCRPHRARSAAAIARHPRASGTGRARVLRAASSFGWFNARAGEAADIEREGLVVAGGGIFVGEIARMRSPMNGTLSAAILPPDAARRRGGHRRRRSAGMPLVIGARRLACGDGIGAFAAQRRRRARRWRRRRLGDGAAAVDDAAWSRAW